MRHFVTEQDVAEELFELLSDAKAFYLQDVMENRKRYDRYVEDFVNCHRHINCDNVACQNCHEMNIHIVKGLLTDYASRIKLLFTATSFSFDKCMELKRMYDTSESLPTVDKYRVDEPTYIPPLSFGCNFTQEQMIDIVSCADTYHLFCVSMLRTEDMEALFTCRKDFCIRVNNIRRVAILFDALLENSFIQPYWQSVLNKGKFLLSKDGNRFISASSLSSALSVARSNVDSISYSIRKSIGQLKK